MWRKAEMCDSHLQMQARSSALLMGDATRKVAMGG